MGLAGHPQHRGVCQYAVADPRTVLCFLLRVPAVYVPHPEEDQRTEPARLYESYDVRVPLDQRLLGLDHARRCGRVLDRVLCHQHAAIRDRQQVLQR